MRRIIVKILLSLLCLSLCSIGIDMAIGFANGEAGIQKQSLEVPQRIIVLPVFAEEILFEMIDPDRIIGVWHDYMEGGEVYTPTMELTKGKECLIEIEDTERIIALNPDLVIAWNANYDLREAIIALEQADIDVLIVDTPVTFDDVREAILLLGDVVGAQDKAADMLQDFNAQCELLAQAISGIAEEDRVRVSDYHEYSPWEVYNKTLAEAAGVISDGGNIFVPNTFYMEIDFQLMAQWNPDLITFAPYYTDTDGTLYEFGVGCVNAYATSLLENPELENTTAVKNNNIHPLCIYQSQYMIQSAIDLAKLAYPDRIDTLFFKPYL